MSNSTGRLPRKAIATLLAAATVGAVAGFAPAATATASASAPSHSGPGLGLDAQYTSPATQERNKRVAAHVLTQLFEEGNLKVADRYISEDYIQHNPAAPNGREAIKNFIRDWTARFPDHQYNVKRVLAQGNLVLVHSNPVYEPGTRGTAVVDIFRFDPKSGMIAEHWDTVQDVPATTVNGNDMFGTVSNPHTNQPSGPRWSTSLSEKIATRYFDTILGDKNPDAVRYLAPEYYQHNPTIPSGSAGLRQQFTNFFRQFPNLIVERKRVIADRDYVAIHAHYRLSPEDRGQSVVDIFRVAKQKNGELKIIEHWDAVQDVPATSANDNTMF
ncbi:nuclear transport factor 2 family protein [Streptomyces sp. AC555_RSS877]|uniref:nuclear transport factor 2 family protein n=1 Tax=Streptomyces sp. AC555_RSS877 TaxID=2823688 RepID=UPI001C271A86|nr:nuclear transport factor 2 family protein [Streptomyces sp. AC555_RSS877]